MINLIQMKKSRRTPSAGDLFVLQPQEGIYLLGKVIRAKWDIPDDFLRGSYVVHLYRKKLNTFDGVESIDLTAEDLLLPPQIINQLAWTKGYFMTVGNKPVNSQELPESYGFYHDFWNLYFDINGIEQTRKPVICGNFAMGNHLTIEDKMRTLSINDPDFLPFLTS